MDEKKTATQADTDAPANNKDTLNGQQSETNEQKEPTESTQSEQLHETEEQNSKAENAILASEAVTGKSPLSESKETSKKESVKNIKSIKIAKSLPQSKESQASTGIPRGRSHPMSMNLFFGIIILAEILLIFASSSGILEIVRSTVDGQKRFPDLLWLAAVCIIAGIATIIFLMRFFSSPIFTLGNAVNKVADGDFSVRLRDDKGFLEMRRINKNFNKMVRELEATEILQTDFVSNVSHEFKTPITAIDGYATLLDGTDATPEQKEYIEKILFNTQRLSVLVGNILLLSKVDNQSIPDKKGIFRLDEQIRQALLTHETAWTEKGLELDVELEEIMHYGNEALLFHVWSNLIGNAVKFGPRGGKVRITLESRGESIVFTVTDEGEGVSDEAKKHIFDRFYQSDSSHKSEGNGLGLALVKQILKLEDGTVSVSDAVPRGAKFTVVLAPKKSGNA